MAEYKFSILFGWRIQRIYEVLNRNKDHYFTRFYWNTYIIQ